MDDSPLGWAWYSAGTQLGALLAVQKNPNCIWILLEHANRLDRYPEADLKQLQQSFTATGVVKGSCYLTA